MTVKQGTDSARGFTKRREWEARASGILSGVDKTEADEAVKSLISEAAPRLKVFAEVSITRLRLPVCLPGCKAELALDSGVFPNGNRFDELELELISGDEGEFHRLAANIKDTLCLEPESRSKLSRAVENSAE